ncbi:MAG TPA: ribonuclease P protein component [Hydrogenothermaceae bacterium]|nr:ribonuclease P protein component [Hydrogenothermaceae bacterium]
MSGIITIKSSKEIKYILKKGNKFYTKHLIFLYQKNSLGFPRFSFIISKKISKKAVVRNRIKRIIKEAVRLNTEKLKDLSFDIVIIAKKGLENKKTYHLFEDIILFSKYLKGKL